MFKRLLLLVLLLSTVSFAFADEVTIYTNSVANTWEAVTDPDEGYQTTSDGFTVAYYKGSYSNSLRDPSSDSDHIRVYKGSILYIAGQGGETITKVVINCKSSYCYDMTVNDTETATADTDALTITWEGSCTEWSGVTSAQTRVSSVVITYGDTDGDTDDDDEEDDDDDTTTELDLTGAGTADSPYTVSDAIALVNAGSYTSESVYISGIISQIYAIYTSYGNANYYISDDGATDTQLYIYRGKGLDGDSILTTDYIQVGDTVVICGVLTLYGSTPEVASGNYLVSLSRPESTGDNTVETTGSGTADDPYTASDAIALCTAYAYTSDSVYVKGIISQIDSIFYTYYGNARYYISDDGTTDSQFYIYNGYGLNGAKFTAADDLLVGDTVVVYGVLTQYGSTPEMAAKGYITYLGSTATDDGDDDSDTSVETTGSGTADSPYTVSDALAIINAGAYTSDDVYTQGIISQIDEVSTSYGNATYYISDDGTTSSQLEVYRGYYLDGAKFTSSDDIQVGDTVIVCGALTLYYSTAEITTGSSITYLGRPASEEGDDDEEEEDEDDGYVYQIVTDDTTLAAGDILTLVNEANSVVIADCAGNYFNYATVSIVESTIAASAVETPITLESAGDGYWRLATTDGYLYAASTESNYLSVTAEALTDSSDIATISIAYDEDDATYYATITFQGESERNTIRFNSGTYGRFSCYRSSTTNVLGVQLYRRTEGTVPDYEPTGAGTAEDPYTVADALAIIAEGSYTSDNVYVLGIISQIDEVSTSYGNATYYISDDGTTDSQFEIYRGYSLDGAKFTSEDEIQVGDTVIVCGVLTLYYSTPEMTSGSSIYYLGRADSDDTEEEDDTTTYATYAKASTLSSGQSYLLVVQDGENTLYAKNPSSSYTYGYLYVNTVSGLTDTLTVDASGYYPFIITASETTAGAYTIQDSYGRYLYQSGTYTSYQLSSSNDGYDWTLTSNDDGTWTIAYAASGYYAQYSTSYSSFGVYAAAQDGALLPYLYELVSTDADDEEEEDTDSATGETFELVTDASSLAAGDVITFASAEYGYSIAEQNENNRNFLTVEVSISDGILTAAETTSTFTLSTADDGNWLIQYDATGYYLTSNSESSNYLSTEESADGLYSEVTIDIASDGTATVVFQGDNERRWLRYNANGYFSVYAEGSQKDLQIYRQSATSDEETAISSISATTTAPKGIYTLQGVKLSNLEGLPTGIYIIDGKKVLVK